MRQLFPDNPSFMLRFIDELLTRKYRRKKQYLWLWIGIAAIWIIVFPVRLLTYSAWNSGKIVEQARATTTGTITSIEPQFHNSANFKYEVAGIEYRGTANGPATSGLQPGSTIIVHYDLNDPAVCVVGNHSPPSFSQNLIGIGVIVTILVITLIGFYYIARDSRRS
jgi:hypothetical protein